MAPEVEKPKPSPEYIQKARTLICALNLISRNIPLPPQLFDAVASIYHSGSDDASDDRPDDGGGDAAAGEGLPAAAVAAPTVIDTCEKKDLVRGACMLSKDSIFVLLGFFVSWVFFFSFSIELG